MSERMFDWMGLLMAAGLAGGTHLSYTIEEYTELQNSLLGNYSSKIRPIKNQGQSLQMEASLWISSINDVSAVDQKMITTAYLNIEWTDELLTWDSTSTGIYWMQINQVSRTSSCSCYENFKTMEIIKFWERHLTET